MFKKKNKWLRFGCFLIGYNYSLLRNCSEASKKAVRKYTAAMLIIMILWLLIGFLFAKEYLRLSVLGSGFLGVILMIVVIQIERQIILGTKNIGTTMFRVVLAFVMAVLGAIIVDQIIFKEDIERARIAHIEAQIKNILPQKIQEINVQIAEIDTLLASKQLERELLMKEVSKQPTIKLPSYESKKVPKTIIVNGVPKDTFVISRSYSFESIPNPKKKSLDQADDQIDTFLNDKALLHEKIGNVREKLEEQLKNNKGFLDELEVMYTILSSSMVSRIVWGLWIVFFLIIELLVLVSKMFEKENDYQKMVHHQMRVRMEALSKLTDSN